MLSLSQTTRGLAAGLSLLASSASLAQFDSSNSARVAERIEQAEKQLDADLKACRPIDSKDYRSVAEAAWAQRNAMGKALDKARNRGIPIDRSQIDRDNRNADRAGNLYERALGAEMAQRRACGGQAQAQPQPKSTGGVPGPTQASAPPAGQTCTPSPRIEPADFGIPEIPSKDEINHTGELLDDAAKGSRLSEADYLLRELDGQAAKLRQVIDDARQAGELSRIDIKEAEKRLEQMNAWRAKFDRYRIPCPPAEPQRTNQTSMSLPSWARDILAAHNAARAAVGAPPLQWNSQLEAHAAARAGELAQARQLIHAPREGRGTERENILSAPIGYSPNRMIDLWSRESRHFRPGLFPDVSDTGNWADVAHYTQMVWPTTTDIGCGYAPGGGFNWLVCRYNPGGNKDGKPVIADANNFIRPRLIGGDYTGRAIDVSDAPNPTVINLLGDGFVYGNIDPQDDEFWAGSVGLIANLSEDTRLELGVCPADYDSEATGFASGIYWDPVAQVTVGAGASYVEPDLPDVDTKVEQPDLTGKPEIHGSAPPPSWINLSDCVM